MLQTIKSGRIKLGKFDSCQMGGLLLASSDSSLLLCYCMTVVSVVLVLFTFCRPALKIEGQLDQYGNQQY